MHCWNSDICPHWFHTLTYRLYHRAHTARYRIYETSQWRKLSISRHYPFCEVSISRSARRETIALRTLSIGNSFPRGAWSVFECANKVFNIAASSTPFIISQTLIARIGNAHERSK